jgi:RecA/RadA recombinase
MLYSDAVKLLAGERGYKIFPCDELKRPLVKWKSMATNDVSQLVSWGETLDPAYAGLVCGPANDLFVIDIDVKDGKVGEESFRKLVDLNGGPDLFPRTPLTVTKSGGYHLYFKYDDVGLSIGQNELGQDIDTRGDGGYVIAYDFADGRSLDDVELPSLPRWCVDKLKSSKVESNGLDSAGVVRDGEGKIIDGKDEYARNLVLAVIKEHERALGHWPLEHELLIVDEVWSRYAEVVAMSKEELTKAGRGLEFIRAKVKYVLGERKDVLSGLTEENEKPKSLSYVKFNELELDVSSSYLMKGWIDQDNVSVVFGPPGSGKSFFVLDMAMHVALGRDYHGVCKVKQAPVIYCPLEGARGVRQRLLAFSERYGLADSNVPFYVCSSSFTLFDDAGVEALSELIRKVAEDAEVAPGLIIIDTLARVMTPGNENAAEDMSMLANNVEKVKDVFKGSHVCLVHHSGKDKSRGARGSNALLGAVDTELSIESEGGIRTVTATKQKDMEPGKPINFKLEPVVLGHDVEGDEITSCVVELADADEVAEAKIHLSPKQKLMFDALVEGLLSGYSFKTSPKSGVDEVWCIKDVDFFKYCEDNGVLTSDNTKAEFNRTKQGLMAKSKIFEYKGVIWM